MSRTPLVWRTTFLAQENGCRASRSATATISRSGTVTKMTSEDANAFGSAVGTPRSIRRVARRAEVNVEDRIGPTVYFSTGRSVARACPTRPGPMRPISVTRFLSSRKLTGPEFSRRVGEIPVSHSLPVQPPPPSAQRDPSVHRQAERHLGGNSWWRFSVFYSKNGCLFDAVSDLSSDV